MIKHIEPARGEEIFPLRAAAFQFVFPKVNDISKTFLCDISVIMHVLSFARKQKTEADSLHKTIK